MGKDPKNVYERIDQLESDVATLKQETDIFKKLLRDKIAKYEVRAIRDGQTTRSILD